MMRWMANGAFWYHLKKFLIKICTHFIHCCPSVVLYQSFHTLFCLSINQWLTATTHMFGSSFRTDNPAYKHFNYSCSWILNEWTCFADISTMGLSANKLPCSKDVKSWCLPISSETNYFYCWDNQPASLSISVQPSSVCGDIANLSKTIRWS